MNQSVNTNFRSNLAYLVSWELIWGIALPCCTIQTIVPVYLHLLGASKFTIQSVMIATTACFVFMLWNRKFIRGPARERVTIFFWWGVSLLWGIYGLLATLFFNALPGSFWAVLFSILALGMSFLTAIATPVSEEIVLQNTPLRKRGRTSSIRLICLGISGVIGIPLAWTLMQCFDKPFNYHLRFIVGSLIMFFSCYLFWKFKDSADERHDTSVEPVRGEVFDMFKHKGFRALLFFYTLLVCAQSIAPLILTYASDFKGMHDMVDWFTGAYLAGTIIFGTAIPPFADRYGFKSMALLNALVLTLGFTCAVGSHLGAFMLLIAYGLYGAYTSLSFIMIAYLGSEMMPKSRPASIVAVANAMTIPFALIVAPLAGAFADRYGETGYLGAFCLAMGFSLCATLGLSMVIREPRRESELRLSLEST